MEKIPSAKEFLKFNIESLTGSREALNITKIMREFAKIHVKKALEIALFNAEIIHRSSEYAFDGPYSIIKADSILNSYPETLIK